jgi:putative oxidoreductase
MRNLVSLSSAQRFSDFALLVLRVFVGLFLVWSVWDNVVNAERMREFADFLGKHGFPSPGVLAPVSVWTQLLIGVAFVLGLFTRWAGILCVLNFAVAIAMVDRFGGMRGIFPSGCLVAIGLYLATHGAGRFSLDSVLRANDVPRSTGSGGVRFKL